MSVDATSIPEYGARCSTGITKQYGGASLYSCGVADSMLHVKLLGVNHPTELRPAVCPQAGGYTSGDYGRFGRIQEAALSLRTK